MANMYFTQGKVGQLDGTFVWGTTVMKAALMSSTYTPALAQSVWTGISGSEMTGTGYTAGGSILAGVAVSSESNSHASVSANNVAWTGSTLVNVAWGIIYATVSGRLVGAYDFGGNNTTSNGTFSISWHSSDGILTLS